MRLPEPRFLVVVAVAFCAGAQLAYAFQVVAGQDWLASDVGFKLLTLAGLVGGGWWLWRGRLLEALPSAPAPRAAPAPAPRPLEATVLAPAPPPPAAPQVRLHLETPLRRGPVWPPGEPLPVTVQVRTPEGKPVPDLDLELELRHTGGVERARVPLKGGAVVLSQTVPVPGHFAIVARALRNGVPVAQASAEGRASSYREEIGRRFELLKSQAAQQGLGVGPDATPRELQHALARRFPGARRSLEELAQSIEIALYSQEEVGRDTYEALVRAIAALERHGPEAMPRA